MASTLNIDLQALALSITADTEIRIPQGFVKSTTNPWSPGNGPVNAFQSIFFRVPSVNAQPTFTTSVTVPNPIIGIPNPPLTMDATTSTTVNNITMGRGASSTMASTIIMTMDYPIVILGPVDMVSSSSSSITGITIETPTTSNFDISRAYEENAFSNIFSSNPPTIVDAESAGDTYEVFLSVNSGFIKTGSATYPYPTNITLSGSKESINTSLSNGSVEYVPLGETTSSVTFTYTVKKNTYTFDSGTFTASGTAGSTVHPEEGLYSSGDTLTFTDAMVARMKLGYTKADVLVVGGGGGGGPQQTTTNFHGGGGGAGGLVYYSELDFTEAIDQYSLTRFEFTAGTGGIGTTSADAFGFGGNQSTIIGYDVSNTATTMISAYGGGGGGRGASNGIQGGSGGGAGYPGVSFATSGGASFNSLINGYFQSISGTKYTTKTTRNFPGESLDNTGNTLPNNYAGDGGGGTGVSYDITGSTVTYAEGGPGGGQGLTDTGNPGCGGAGAVSGSFQPATDGHDGVSYLKIYKL